MTFRTFRNRTLPPGSRTQRGVVLFIALIVLVAMSLAGIAIMRSVDTGNLIAGNVAFKQGTLTSADYGVDEAYRYLENNKVGDHLWINQEQEGYRASVDDPDWSDNSTWADAHTVGTDAAGNTIQYLIHRMCPGGYQGNHSGGGCATTKITGGQAGNSKGQTLLDPPKAIVVYYRVTVRVDGPRETMSVVQSNIGVPQQP